MFIDCKGNNWIAVNTNLVRYLAIQHDSLTDKYRLQACFIDDKGAYLELGRSDSLEEIEKLKDRIVSEINANERRTHA